MKAQNQKNSNLKLAVKNSFYGFLSLACRLCGSSLIYIIIPRLPSIGVSEYGQLTYAITLAGLFITISQFGFFPLLIRDIAADKTRLSSYARSIFSLRIIFSFISIIILIMYVNYIKMTDQGRLVCYIVTIAFFIGSFSMDFQAVFQSQERMNLEFIGITIENGFMIIWAIIAFFFKPDIIHLACIFIITKSIGLLINYFICGKFTIWMFPIINLNLWKNIIKEATPFALTSIITLGIVQIDTILLRQLSPGNPEYSVGLYQAAVQLFLVPMLLPQIVLKVFLPQLTRIHSQSLGSGFVRDLGKVNHILLTLGFLIGLITVFRGSDLIMLFYGKKLIKAGVLLQILGMTIMMRFGAAYTLYFTIQNKIWFRVFSGVIGLVSVIVFDILFIPKYGAIGAAYASVCAHIVYWIPFFIALYKNECTIILGLRIIPMFTALAMLTFILYITAKIPIMYMLPLYTIIVLFLTFITMDRKEKKRIITQYLFKGVV